MTTIIGLRVLVALLIGSSVVSFLYVWRKFDFASGAIASMFVPICVFAVWFVVAVFVGGISFVLYG